MEYQFENVYTLSQAQMFEYYKANIPVFIGFVISFIASLVFVFAGPKGIMNLLKNHN